MDDKLFRQSGVDKLDGKGRIACSGSPFRNMAEQAVGDERVAFGSKNDREHFFLEQKCHDAAQHSRNGNLYQGSPQYIQMLPKRHLADLSFLSRLLHIVI